VPGRKEWKKCDLLMLKGVKRGKSQPFFPIPTKKRKEGVELAKKKGGEDRNYLFTKKGRKKNITYPSKGGKERSSTPGRGGRGSSLPW